MMYPQHNIPLMRRILNQIVKHPETVDMADFTKDVAGWAIKLSGTDWQHVHPDAGHEAVEMVDFRTGCVSDICDVTSELLGTTTDETIHLLYNGPREVRSWLEDAVIAGERKTFDAIIAIEYAEADS